MDLQNRSEANPEDVCAASAGYLALEVMERRRPATVLGATSRGLFLRSDSRWLIFLSYEQYRSPFTITLQRPEHRLRTIATKSAVHVQRDRLTFPGAELAVHVAPQALWRPAHVRGRPEPFAVQLARLRAAAGAARAGGREGGLAPVLDYLLSSPGAGVLSREQRRLLEGVLQWQRAVSGATNGDDVAAACAAASTLLGLGRGLTASGDDFLVGFLLFLNRRVASDSRPPWLQPLNQALAAAAYEKTTTLSANLIECAGRGEGDERLVAAADHLLLGTPALDECLEPLLGWGASSGVDALAGMAVALLLETGT